MTNADELTGTPPDEQIVMRNGITHGCGAIGILFAVIACLLSSRLNVDDILGATTFAQKLHVYGLRGLCIACALLLLLVAYWASEFAIDALRKQVVALF